VLSKVCLTWHSTEKSVSHINEMVNILKPIDYLRQSDLHSLANIYSKMWTPTSKIRSSCNGLQWKWLRTAINGNLGPDYLHLSIPSGRDYLPLSLQSAARDCNQRRWDHITCDSPEPPSSACLCARGSTCISQERLGGVPVSDISRPGAESVSSHLKLPYGDGTTVSPPLAHVGVPSQDSETREPVGRAPARHLVSCR
jgi:hypothetical protein